MSLDNNSHSVFLFDHVYEFEKTCPNVQFIQSPIEVREFLLRLLKEYLHEK